MSDHGHRVSAWRQRSIRPGLLQGAGAIVTEQVVTKRLMSAKQAN